MVIVFVMGGGNVFHFVWVLATCVKNEVAAEMLMTCAVCVKSNEIKSCKIDKVENYGISCYSCLFYSHLQLQFSTDRGKA